MSAANKIIELGRLCLQFGRVNRATYHEDGIRPETDTDHTVMLGVITCAYAAAYDPRLDLGLVAQFALVHDLVEVYAGDTNTLLPRLHADNAASTTKEARETAALNQIRVEFDATFPWLAATIKCLRQLSFTTLHQHGVGAHNIDAINGSQIAAMSATYAADQPVVMQLYADIHDLLKVELSREEGVS